MFGAPVNEPPGYPLMPLQQCPKPRFHPVVISGRDVGALVNEQPGYTVMSPIRCSATKFEEGQGVGRVVKHQPTFPSGVKGPEECENELQVIDRLVKSGRMNEEQAELARARYSQDPFEFCSVGVSPDSPQSPDTPINSDPLFYNPALAYISDSWFIGTVGRVNPEARRDKVGMMVSLDHTIHFHAGEKTRLDEWLLLETRSSWAGEERGLVRMNVWTQGGELLAQCLQEGMVRLKDGREGTDVQHAAAGTSTPKELKESAKL
ncbi:HotDog domain-containing protein [Pyronema domesticum]|nr:HotDog domain-containing protein [Pyronema domesticum]